MHRNFDFCKPNGYSAFMTPFVWMFIKSYEKLRQEIIQTKCISTLIQLEYSAFEEATVPICTFVLRNSALNYKGNYLRLSDFKGGMDVQNEMVLKAQEDPACKYRYTAQQDNFSKIPGAPVAYWVSEKFYQNYGSTYLSNFAEVITGMTIGDNNLYLRIWHEVAVDKINIGKKNMKDIEIVEKYYIPYSKGGQRRNWYGNYDYIVNWSKKDNFNRAKTTLQRLYLREAITWPFVTSGNFSARILPNGFLWDVAGSPCFFDDIQVERIALAALCSKPINYILTVVNPTINVQAVDIARLPFSLPNCDLQVQVSHIANACIKLSKIDWDSFEISWDFKKHPMI